MLFWKAWVIDTKGIYFIFSGHADDVVVDNYLATDYTNMLLLKMSLGNVHKLSTTISALVQGRRLGWSSSFCFSKFNCDQCSKHIETPECKACDRMVNYFRIFNMHCSFYPVPKIMPSTQRPYEIWPKIYKKSSIQISPASMGANH